MPAPHRHSAAVQRREPARAVRRPALGCMSGPLGSIAGLRLGPFFLKKTTKVSKLLQNCMCSTSEEAEHL